jgi:hypothetical protein
MAFRPEMGKKEAAKKSGKKKEREEKEAQLPPAKGWEGGRCCRWCLETHQVHIEKSSATCHRRSSPGEGRGGVVPHRYR